MKKETAKLAAKWWASKLRSPAKLDNGDTSENGFMTMALATILQDKERAGIQDETISKFQDELEKRISKLDDKRYCHIGVDYGPCAMLQESADAAGLKLGMTSLPWKTNMSIQDDKITVSEGYGAPYVDVTE